MSHLTIPQQRMVDAVGPFRILTTPRKNADIAVRRIPNMGDDL